MCSTKLSGTDVPSKDNPHLVILSTNMEHTAASNWEVVPRGDPGIPRGAGDVLRGTVRVWPAAGAIVCVDAVPTLDSKSGGNGDDGLESPDGEFPYFSSISPSRGRTASGSPGCRTNA